MGKLNVGPLNLENIILRDTYCEFSTLMGVRCVGVSDMTLNVNVAFPKLINFKSGRIGARKGSLWPT